jgi:hypothetical protein
MGENTPVRAYLPPTGIPKDTGEEYVVFSFTYKSDPSAPSVVLGVHAAAHIVSKEGVLRPGTRRISGVEDFVYHIEADPDFVTLFSTPLSYDPKLGRYSPPYRSWGFGLRYIEPEHAANILNDALAGAQEARNMGTDSYRSFVERGIEVINRIRAAYALDHEPAQNQGMVDGRSWLPDKALGQKGEEFVFRQEQEYAVRNGLPQHMVSWTSQSNPSSPYDIETVRLTTNSHRPHFIEVKSTTIADLTNIYISQREIDWLKSHEDASSLVVLVFGPEENPTQQTLSVAEFLDRFDLVPIQFRLKPLR